MTTSTLWFKREIWALLYEELYTNFFNRSEPMRMYVRNGPSVIICCTFFSAAPLSREYLEHVYLYTQHSGPSRREDLIKTLPTNSWPHGALSQRCARLPGSMEVIMQAPLTSWEQLWKNKTSEGVIHQQNMMDTCS